MSQEKSFEIRNNQAVPRSTDQSANSHSEQSPKRKKNHAHSVKHIRVLPVIEETYSDS